MMIRRRFLTLPLAAGTPLAMSLANTATFAQDASKIYLGFPPGSTVWISAALISEALGKQLKLAYGAEARPGEFTKLGMDAFRKDAAVDSKLILATSGEGYPSVNDFQLIAIVGHMRNLPVPFGLYADRQMPSDKVEAIRKVVEKLVSDGTIPR